MAISSTRGTRGHGPKLEMYEPASVSRALLWGGWGVRVEASGDMEVEVAQSRRTLCDPVDSIQSMEVSRAEHWSGQPFTSSGDLTTQGSDPGLPHCRQILYQLSHDLQRWVTNGDCLKPALGCPDFSPRLNLMNLWSISHPLPISTGRHQDFMIHIITMKSLHWLQWFK